MKSGMKIIMLIGVLGMCLAGPAGAQTDAYLPAVQVGGFNINGTAASYVAPTVTFTYAGTDPDAPEGESGLPMRVRFLYVPAEIDGVTINTKYLYDQHYEELIDFADQYWSPWMPYPEDPQQCRITFSDQADQEYYLFAVQVMDRDGAVSLSRRYGIEVVNIQIRADLFRPQVVLDEYYLGSTTGNRVTEIASGQPLNFSWIASAATYGGQIVSYRHGFDLTDPDDPDDPGWAVPPGLAPTNLYAEERIFVEGYHRFTVRVVDDSGQVTLLNWDLPVVPYISPEYQYPLLVIDQVVDSQSNMWPGEDGTPYDREQYRNAFYQFLDGPEGVVGFDWEQDRRDHTEQVAFSDLVYYRAVLTYARSNSSQLMFNEFRPVDGQDKYVWLAPYQQQGGNLFLVGDRSMESFLEQLPNYVVPMIFDTQETTYSIGGDVYILGFGTTELPDGSEVLRGPRMYPYATAGLAALDWSVPVNKYIYGRAQLASQDRKAPCAGIKGLVTDPAFRDHFAVPAGTIADTLWTNPLIDWRDDVADTLDTVFPFTGDEFIDFNISNRPTPIVIQDCAEGPDGRCLEPMFTGLARFDWMREQRWAEGDEGWPYSTYPPSELDDICGPLALTSLDGTAPDTSARTNGRVYGYLSYKNVEDKPGGKPDVYWGFDPYRFDHEQSRQAIRWVLQMFGLNTYRQE